MVKNKLVLVVSMLLLMIATIFIISSDPTYALPGWTRNDSGEWTYLNENELPIQNKWMDSKGHMYYLGSNGIIVKNSFVEQGENLYYVKEDGKQAVNEWVLIDADISGSEDREGWYYFGSDGRAYKGHSDRVVPREINGKKYGFDTEGCMLTGLIKEDGNPVADEDEYPFQAAMYFFGDSGAMYKNRWYLYSNNLDPTNTSSLGYGRNYDEYEQMWLYFGADGKKVAANPSDNYQGQYGIRTRQIDGNTYRFDENGVLIPHFSVNRTGATPSNADTTIYLGSLDTQGYTKANYWRFVVPAEIMDQSTIDSIGDYDSQEYAWFWTKADGKVIRDRIYTVYNKKYAFDKLGRMQTGFVIMYDNGKFAIKYGVDEFDSSEFTALKNSSFIIPSLDRGNLYLFNTDEINDGSMVAGREVNVDLNDGPAVFRFKDNGKAYGNRFTVEKADNKFYYNGLRLEADLDIGYGIVDINAGDILSSTHQASYVVVDKNGRWVKAKRRVIKDREGMWIVIKDNKFIARVGDDERPRWHNGDYYHYNPDLEGPARYTAPVMRDVYSNTGGSFKILGE